MPIVLTRSDLAELLPMSACIPAIESAFAADATLLPAVLGAHVPDGGFHVKAAGFSPGRSYFAAKVNSNFPGNPRRFDRPTIQGALILFDATTGSPLAIMDSAEITKLRTAATTAVAAKYLARPDAGVLTICGCGVQGRVHLEAMRAVRPVRAVFAVDTDAVVSSRFARDLSAPSGIDIQVAPSLRAAAVQSDIVVTCTSATTPLLSVGDVRGGTFVAAVGADSERKQEIDPDLMRSAAVVVDILEQCATIGDLHHAIDAGVMGRDDVHADLAAIVSGRAIRPVDDRVVIFDSTGTALEDVAAAAWAYEGAQRTGRGLAIDLTA